MCTLQRAFYCLEGVEKNARRTNLNEMFGVFFLSSLQLLVTEKRQTTEHEEFHDDELPEEDDHSTGSRERIERNVS